MSLRQIDILEPASTICSVIVGVPSLINSVYVYVKLLKDKRFSTNLYFRIFITLGVVNIVAFLMNLVRYRLALLRPINKFYGSIRETPLASFLRLSRHDEISTCSDLHLPWLPPAHSTHRGTGPVGQSHPRHTNTHLLHEVPDTIMGYRYVPFLNCNNLTIYITQAWPNQYESFMATMLIVFQFTFTVIGIIENVLLVVFLIALKSGWSVGKNERDNKTEQGLIFTTLAIFSAHLTFSFLQASYLWIWFLIPEFKAANRGTAIVLDILSVLPIWMFLAFSPAVRNCAYPGLFSADGGSKATTQGSTKVDKKEVRYVTVVSTV